MEQKLFCLGSDEAVEIKPKQYLFEHALQSEIAENPSILNLGGRFADSKPELVGCEMERVDLVFTYIDGNDVVPAFIELKNVKATIKAFNQLLNYLNNAKKVNSIMTQIVRKNPNAVAIMQPIGILVAPDFDPDTEEMIKKSTAPEVYGVIINRYKKNGMEFFVTQIIYPSSCQRDYTKYTFTDRNGNTFNGLGKGRLAYKVIETYLSDNPTLTIGKLMAAFPKALANHGQGSQLTIVHDAATLSGDLKKRYFSEALRCADGECRVCNQWGSGNIKGIIAKATELGYIIKEEK